MANNLTNPSRVQSLYNFMEQLNKNNVRSNNLFEMRVFIPDSLIAKISTGSYNGTMLTHYLNPNFTFYGQGFELPNRQIQYADVGFKGFTVPVPTTLKMGQDHTVTINADIEGNMRRAFIAWQALTINPQINDNGGYFEGNRHLGQSSSIRISLLDPEYGNVNRVVETYTLYGVTVQEVGTMTFDNKGSDIATFTVQFKSQYWQHGYDSKQGGNGTLSSTQSYRGSGIDPSLVN